MYRLAWWREMVSLALVVGLGCAPAQQGPSENAGGDQGAAATGATDGRGASSHGAGGSGGEDSCAPKPRGKVTFSPASGTFEGAVTVELSTPLPSDELRYTTDHSAPTATSPLYTEALIFDATTDLRVQVYARGKAVGPPSGAVYVARGGDEQHDLPVLVLDSFGHTPPSDERDYLDVALLGFETVDGVTSLAQAPKLATQAAFHVRGQSSSRYEKRPYRLELRAPTNDDRDCPMFGMPSESDWVLHSPFPDKSLIRNAFAYSLGKEMGLAAPRFNWVELYLNSDGGALDSGDYQGVYLLVETIKNHAARLNLRQLEPTDTSLPDLSGGYIFKFEWQVANFEQPLPCPVEQANCWNYIEVVDPKPWAPEQRQYLTRYLQQVTYALHLPSPTNDVAGYPAFLDVSSFVNTVIITEVTRNLDAYVRSQFMHKDRDGKLVAGPLWDFDLSAGVGMNVQAPNLSTSGFQYEAAAQRFEVTADWFPRLLAEPTFDGQLRARYRELRQGLLSDDEIGARLAMLARGLEAGAARNFARWDNLTDPNAGGFISPIADSWEGQLGAMHAWLIERLDWLDSQWL
jgi:hypothetical protein